jgi:hypothetical protein
VRAGNYDTCGLMCARGAQGMIHTGALCQYLKRPLCFIMFLTLFDQLATPRNIMSIVRRLIRFYTTKSARKRKVECVAEKIYKNIAGVKGHVKDVKFLF